MKTIEQYALEYEEKIPSAGTIYAKCDEVMPTYLDVDVIEAYENGMKKALELLRKEIDSQMKLCATDNPYDKGRLAESEHLLLFMRAMEGPPRERGKEIDEETMHELKEASETMCGYNAFDVPKYPHLKKLHDYLVKTKNR